MALLVRAQDRFRIGCLPKCGQQLAVHPPNAAQAGAKSER
jgi:hypothetical protein